VTYIGELAIHSASVQSHQVNADVLGNAMIDSDPDETGSAAGPSDDFDEGTNSGPTDAVVQDVDATAPAQPSFSAMPRLCVLSTAAPTNRDVPPGSIVHSPPNSYEDVDPGDSGNDHQRAQSPVAVGPAALKSPLLKALPALNLHSPTQPPKTMTSAAAAATPTTHKVKVPFARLFFSDFDPRCLGDDHQSTQPPVAVGPAALKPSLLRKLPTCEAPSTTQPRTPEAVRRTAVGVQALGIAPDEETDRICSRRRTQAAKQTTPNPQRRRKKKRDKGKRPLQMPAVVKPKARHPYGGGGLIGASTPGPQLDSDVGDRMAILPRSVQRRTVDVLPNHMIDSAPGAMSSPPAESSFDVDDALDNEPTDAVFQNIDEAPAQPLPSASPEMCFLLSV
jgi:hypothetical protein